MGQEVYQFAQTRKTIELTVWVRIQEFNKNSIHWWYLGGDHSKKVA